MNNHSITRPDRQLDRSIDQLVTTYVRTAAQANQAITWKWNACVPVHVDVRALGELFVAQAAALQEGGGGGRLLVAIGAVDHQRGLADDVRPRRRRRRLLLLPVPNPGVVALAVGGLQENSQPRHGLPTA